METKICAKCHVEQPITEFSWANKLHTYHTSYCKSCVRKASAIYYKKNRTKVLLQTSQYYQDHREVHDARSLAWWKAHPEKRRAKELSHRRKYPQKSSKKATLYRQRHPEKVRILHARRKARRRGLPDTFTYEQWMFMMEYWHHACVYCGNQEGLLWSLVDDHFIPLSDPLSLGTVVENMLPACNSTQSGGLGCNSIKNGKDPHIWLVEKFGKRKAAKIEKTIISYFQIVHEKFSTA